jgi:hypothetical protein
MIPRHEESESHALTQEPCAVSGVPIPDSDARFFLGYPENARSVQCRKQVTKR